MRELLLALRDLCLLRVGPQDLPFAPGLFALLVAVRFLLDSIVGNALGALGIAISASVLSTALALGAIYALLRMRGLQARFVQVGTALTAAGLAFSILAVPAQFALSPMPEDPAAFSGTQLAVLLVVLLIGGWSLAVTAHVLRHALERTFFQGLMIALLINFGIAIVLHATLPTGV